MPVYDQVLGSYLDLEGVPIDMRAAAQQLYGEAISNDDDQRRASIAAVTTAKTRDFGRLIAALQDPGN